MIKSSKINHLTDVLIIKVDEEYPQEKLEKLLDFLNKYLDYYKKVSGTVVELSIYNQQIVANYCQSESWEHTLTGCAGAWLLMNGDL